MWHKNTNGTIGEDFYTDPSGFTVDLFQVHYIESKKVPTLITEVLDIIIFGIHTQHRNGYQIELVKFFLI
jgi:hypothetical protein